MPSAGDPYVKTPGRSIDRLTRHRQPYKGRTDLGTEAPEPPSRSKE
jgi:hypothetical protein